MTNPMTNRADHDPGLDELGVIVEELAAREREVSCIREERDQLMWRLLERGLTERRVADAANVSATYAHRVRTGRGKPLSGPVEDRRRRQTGK